MSAFQLGPWLHLSLTAILAISIPFLVALSRPHDPEWSARVVMFSTSYTALMASFNLVVTILISVRLYMLRRKVEQVLGKVQAMYYNCPVSTFVESGGFFSLWITFYAIVFARRSWIQDAILMPSAYISVSSFLHLIALHLHLLTNLPRIRIVHRP